MSTRARLVPATEHGAVTATLGQRLRAVVALRVEQILAGAAAGARRLRMFRPG